MMNMLRNSRQTGGNFQGGNGNCANASGRSFKEVLKVFVTMMVEDIWANYEGFSWQKKVL